MTATLTGLTLGLASCGNDGATIAEFNDVDDIASELERKDGGLTTTDEQPMFGQADLFEDSDLAPPETAYNDDIEQDPAVVAMLGDVDAVLYHTTVIWGQIPGNSDNETAFNWGGALSVNRGAIIVRRVLAFEERTDQPARRTDPHVVEFRSLTRPHHDGLRLLIVDPDPTSDEPLVLRYTRAEGGEFAAAKQAAATPQPPAALLAGAAGLARTMGQQFRWIKAGGEHNAQPAGRRTRTGPRA
ncbi:MAG: hypothetical protein MJE77_41830 [Proteobacteria bacterium]|nr:hypothetical protein [Pseudomonadota bacterium]